MIDNSDSCENTLPLKINTKTDLHPCQYCEKPCRGKQCKECHMNMVKERTGECADCKCSFNAKRFDGTLKKRCTECHKTYIEKYISNCSNCGNKYRKVLDDGRIFDKCFDCYKENNKTKESIMNKDCKTSGCKCKTVYTFCIKCNDYNKNLSSTYMTYTCQKCGIRGRGDYKLCEDCEK